MSNELCKESSIPQKPRPPLNRIIRDYDVHDKCPKCGSSLVCKFDLILFSIASNKCVNALCENYYDKR